MNGEVIILPLIEPDLAALAFRAETNPAGPAVDLVWDLPAGSAFPDPLVLRILRRERRFPGRSRRGVLPVTATEADLTDGDPVYEAASFQFDFEETREEREGALRISTTRLFSYAGLPRDRILAAAIRREYRAGEADPVRTTVRVIDRRGLVPGTIYYYTAFVAKPSLVDEAAPQPVFSRLTQASALATGQYGYDLFRSLPQIAQRLDTARPEPATVALADRDKGQLERFVKVFQAHADLLHGSIEGLRDLHDIRRVDSRLLGPLAQLIGWRLKDYLDEDGQRNEIGYAPEVYRRVGTLPSLQAMVNRLTGWDAKVREFVRNVLVGFDASRLEQLQHTGTIYLDGSLALTAAFRDYLDGIALAPPPPYLEGRRVPIGSVNTADAAAMFKLRTRAFDDTTAFTYDCGRPNTVGGYDRDDKVWYNRETIGVYIVPDVDTEMFSPQDEIERIRQILREFLPIQVRMVFFLLPFLVVEEPYNAVQEVKEQFEDEGVLLQEEHYGEGADEGEDRIPGWRWFVTNRLDHRSVNTAVLPVDTSSRTWHTGLAQGL